MQHPAKQNINTGVNTNQAIGEVHHQAQCGVICLSHHAADDVKQHFVTKWGEQVHQQGCKHKTIAELLSSASN